MPLVSKAFGDIITFTRASSATFVGSNGLIQSTPQSKNLLTWTEAFDNAAWTATGSSVAANIIVSPDGTVNGDNLIESSGSNAHRVSASISVTIGTIYTLSVYAKASTRTFLQVFFGATEFGTNAFANFNLSTGVLGTVGSSSTAVITPVGNGWYRCSVTASATATGAAGSALIQIVTSSTAVRNENYTGDGTSGIFIWGAQLEVGSTATDYTKNDGGLFPPRFDYDPVTLAAKGLLIEEQRTNIALYSDDFGNATWSKTGATVSANAATSPDGSSNADTLVEDTSTGAHRVFQAITCSANTAYTFTAFIKAAGRTQVQIIETTILGAFFDLSNGTVLSTNPGITSSIDDFGNGWYRCRISGTTGAAQTSFIAQIRAVDSGGSSSYTGNGAASLNMYGAQLEAGSFATSYIPTVASQVTRSADVASVNTLSPWFNATEGTVYTEASSIYGTSGLSYTVSALDDGTNNNRISTRRNQSTLAYGVETGGVNQVNLTTSFADTNLATFKVAAAYKADDFAASFNGAAALTDTLGTVPTGLVALRLGYPVSTSGGQRTMNGHIRRITYYPRKLSSAELQALTA